MADPRLLGMTRPWTFRDKVYQVSPRTFEEEALFRVKLESDALDAVERQKDRRDVMWYQLQLAGWRHDCAAKVYNFGGPVATQAMFSEDGMKYLAWLSLVKASPDVTMQLVDAIYDDAQAWESLCAVIGALNDPNRGKPEKEKASPAA